jgi:hypothetical protein
LALWRKNLEVLQQSGDDQENFLAGKQFAETGSLA